MFADFRRSTFDKGVVARRRNNIKRPENRHAAPHQNCVGTAKTRQRNLPPQLPDHRDPKNDTVPNDPAIRRRMNLLQNRKEPKADKDHVNDIAFQKGAEIDQHLRRFRQISSKVGEHFRKNRNHKNQKHIHKNHRQRDHRDRIRKRRLNLLRQRQAIFKISYNLKKNLMQTAARISSLNHRNENPTERIRKIRRRVRKRGSAGNIRTQLADDRRKIRIFRLLLKRLQRRHQRKPSFQHRSELLSENRQIGQLDLVRLRLLLVMPPPSESLRFAKAQFSFPRTGTRDLG